MSTSIEPERYDAEPARMLSAPTGGSSLPSTEFRSDLDLYAESELRHRQERTERAIKRAEEQRA